jgi:hypothetical protein
MSDRGRCYKLEQSFQVIDAVINEGESVALDWQESRCKGYLRVTKSGGGLYTGTWGYAGFPGEDPSGEVELAVFRACEGATILFGRWWGPKYPDEQFVIHVLPK